MRIPASLRRLRDDARGATIIEFAVAAPVLILLLMGIFDMAYNAYIVSVLRGAVQEASRRNSLEIANTAQSDAYVEKMVKTVAPAAAVTFKRVSYYDFADIKRAELWNDKNGNGRCDNAEIYTDENRNNRWDADVGTNDNGGANDVVLYTATVKYKPVFVVPFMPNAGALRTQSATAVQKNQPFALQEKYGSSSGTCS